LSYTTRDSNPEPAD